jgi:hypothetical protein
VRIFLMLALAALAVVPCSAGMFEYALDDGAGNYNIGPSQFNAQLLWGNCFVAEPGYETIDVLSVSLAGSVPLDREITMILFDDPTNDLDPNDAVPLATATAMTFATPPNTFIDFDIPDTPVSGTFFVAAIMRLAQHEVAARMDPDTNSGRSWLFFDGDIDLNNLGGSPLYYNMAGHAVQRHVDGPRDGHPGAGNVAGRVAGGCGAALARLSGVRGDGVAGRGSWPSSSPPVLDNFVSSVQWQGDHVGSRERSKVILGAVPEGARWWLLAGFGVKLARGFQGDQGDHDFARGG